MSLTGYMGILFGFWGVPSFFFNKSTQGGLYILPRFYHMRERFRVRVRKACIICQAGSLLGVATRHSSRLVPALRHVEAGSRQILSIRIGRKLIFPGISVQVQDLGLLSSGAILPHHFPGSNMFPPFFCCATQEMPFAKLCTSVTLKLDALTPQALNPETPKP